jgi:hypothetical protein
MYKVNFKFALTTFDKIMMYQRNVIIILYLLMFAKHRLLCPKHLLSCISVGLWTRIYNLIMGVFLSLQFKTSGYLACRSQLEISLSLHIVAVSIAWRNTQ